MNYNGRQRQRPPHRISGSFGPYSVRELEAARNELIDSIYGKKSGGILTRIKIKTGILPNHHGIYDGAPPHPETNVTFESQSCGIVTEDPFPWMKEEIPPPRDGNHGDQMLNGHSNHNEQDGPRYFQNRHPNEREFSRNNIQIPTCSSSYQEQVYPNNGFIPLEPDPRDEGNSRPSLNYSQPSRKRTERDSPVDEFQQSAKAARYDYQHDQNSSRDSSENYGVSGRHFHNFCVQNSSISADFDRERTPINKSFSHVTRTINTNDDNECDVYSDDDHSSEVDGKTKCYKCDFCSFVRKDSSTVMNHLTGSNHYAASEYYGEVENGKVLPKFLHKTMALVNEDAKFGQIIPMCPTCYQPFTNIHSCITHSEMKHKLSSYGLGQNVKTRKATIFTQFSCHMCMMNFKTSSLLNAHMKKQGHEIYQSPGENEVAVMLCTYCPYKRMFLKFTDYETHLRSHHGQKRNTLDIKIFYIQTPIEAQELLPRVQKDERSEYNTEWLRQEANRQRLQDQQHSKKTKKKKSKNAKKKKKGKHVIDVTY